MFHTSDRRKWEHEWKQNGNECLVSCAHIRLRSWWGGPCRNELRHWRELMTGKAGLRELCSSSGAAFHHQSVSPGKRCDFLCASVMISCTWLSLHSPVLPGTLSAAFLNQVPLTQFLFKQYNIGWYVGTPPRGFLHLPHALWIFWLMHPNPRESWTCCSITMCWLAHGY